MRPPREWLKGECHQHSHQEIKTSERECGAKILNNLFSILNLCKAKMHLTLHGFSYHFNCQWKGLFKLCHSISLDGELDKKWEISKYPTLFISWAALLAVIMNNGWFECG